MRPVARVGPDAARGRRLASGCSHGGLGPLRLATGLASRLRGLILRKPAAGVMLIAPCRDIHTFGMQGPIDVAFVDATGLVVEAHRTVGPGRRLRCRRAVAVLERFSDAGSWLGVGDRVEIAIACGRQDDGRLV